MYSYLAGLSHQMVGLSVMVVVGSMILFRNFSHWGGLLIGLVVAYLLSEKTSAEGNNFVEQMVQHLDSPLLKDTKYFYLDPNLIVLFVEIGEYHDYNPIVYYQLKHVVDQILRNLRVMEVGVERPANILQESINLMEQSFKLFDSFEHRIPSIQEALSKHEHVKTRLRKLLYGHLDKIYNLTGKHYQRTGINSNTKFIYPHHPSAFSFDGADFARATP